jgi:hypothetical protein
MADVIDSSHKDPRILMAIFKQIAEKLNKQYKELFFSPITITLGDEFQSVVRSLKAGLDIIFAFEEEIIHNEANFKLRYVLNYGEINTPINSESAYGMLGKGLIETREMLEGQKKSKDRFIINIEEKRKKNTIKKAFSLYQYLIDEWRPKDYDLISELIKQKHYSEIAEKLGKDPSSIWRKSKSLEIDVYLEAKELLLLLSEK